MPIKIQSDLPVKEILEQENIFVMDDTRAMHQDIRPIQILILNLMPLKEDSTFRCGVRTAKRVEVRSIYSIIIFYLQLCKLYSSAEWIGIKTLSFSMDCSSFRRACASW